ncbi:MAG: hypothetical protein WC052_05265 [Patescibacteria group bacterium]
MEQKSWYKSKTVWLNVAIIALGAAAEVTKLFPEAAQAALIVAGLLNFALRFKTQQGLK